MYFSVDYRAPFRNYGVTKTFGPHFPTGLFSLKEVSFLQGCIETNLYLILGPKRDILVGILSPKACLLMLGNSEIKGVPG
jgi:hypothetical protein